MSQGAVGIGVACCQLVFGLAYLIWGLRGNAYRGNAVTGRLLTRYFAPVGLWFMLAAAFQLLMGRVANAPLITLAGLSFLAIGVWAIQIHRTFKAHARELIRERDD